MVCGIRQGAFDAFTLPGITFKPVLEVGRIPRASPDDRRSLHQTLRDQADGQNRDGRQLFCAAHRSTSSTKGFNIMDAEPARGLPVETAARYGYGLSSARYGNIYTARQLYQLAREAFGSFSPTNLVWRRSDRFFDAMRLSVEPNGLGIAERCGCTVNVICRKSETYSALSRFCIHVWSHGSLTERQPVRHRVSDGSRHDRRRFPIRKYTNSAIFPSLKFSQTFRRFAN